MSFLDKWEKGSLCLKFRIVRHLVELACLLWFVFLRGDQWGEASVADRGEREHLLLSTPISSQAMKGINGDMPHDDLLKLFFCLLLAEAWAATSYFVVSCRLLLPEKKKKSLFMEGEDVAEKTLVHKTAVKRISTHWDQENVKKYVLPRTLLPTWSLLQKINTATLQVSGNLVTENKLSYLDPWTLIKKKKNLWILLQWCKWSPRNYAESFFAFWLTKVPQRVLKTHEAEAQASQ